MNLILACIRNYYKLENVNYIFNINKYRNVSYENL